MVYIYIFVFIYIYICIMWVIKTIIHHPFGKGLYHLFSRGFPGFPGTSPIADGHPSEKMGNIWESWHIMGSNIPQNLDQTNLGTPKKTRVFPSFLDTVIFGHDL